MSQRDLSKSLISVALSALDILKTYLMELSGCIEPSSQLPRHFQWLGIFATNIFGEPDMPKAARISAKIAVTPVPSAASETSDSRDLVSIALFSGIGLLVSLVAVLCGVNGVWI